VVESGEWPGYTVSYPDATLDYAVDGETITNTQDKTNLAVTKAWKNADGTTTAPDGAEVTFTLYAGDNATNYTVTLDGTVDSAVVGTGGYESAAWKASFVNLPKYRNENGTEVEIQYTVKEDSDGQWPGYTVSYEGGETATFAVNGGVITNTEVPTELSVTKAWKNADGSTTAPEDGEVTFTLYADGNATNYTVTLDGTADTAVTGAGGYESAAWTATFVNLPKYRIEEGKVVEIQYTVKEDSDGQWPGYTVSYPNATVDYATNGETITNTQEVTTLKVTKAWKNADGTTTAPDGGKVTFTLYADGDATDLTLELDGARDMILPIPGRTSAIETESWVATFFNVPKYKIENGAAVEIEYTVVESGTWPGYTVSYEGGENVTYAVDNGKITNTQDKTELSVIKAWKNADGSTTAPDGAEVIFTLFADGAETDYAVTLDGNADTTAPTVTGGYESEAWKATFVNLPKYKLENGEKVEIQYTVKETGSWAGYEVIYEGEDAVFAIADGVITNIQKVIGLTVTKAWQNADGSTTAPDGAKVTFTLYADGSATEYTVELDGTPETTEPEVTGGYESEAWKAKFVNLPKFKEVEGKEVEIEYTVVESGTWPGYTVSYEGGENVTYAVDNGVITNTQEPTELSVTKAWKNADGTTTPPEDAEVTFTLYADGAATYYTVTLDGEADTTMPNVTGGYESDSWKATFVKLPKYKIENGAAVEIEYTIQETGTWPGYAVSYGDGTTAEYAVDGGTITNEQITTEIGGTKTWNDDDFFVDGVPVDGYQRPESITVNLLADGTVIDSKTVTEDDEWEYEFTDLPKYRIENGTAVEIVYTVEEETVGGYSTEIEVTDIFNTPIKAERVTPTQIWLVKVDALTYTEPEPEDPI
ncbi:MAG: Cna B-type domain-containing protein, partial [Firmicutes bacterium]|nr:Cna B-type domain-containing protein [Bacillota bacterium]